MRPVCKARGKLGVVNRLADETSPYLLQHADNPVDWYPWGEEALSRARDEDRPILLSIGYAACHWCHVMEHESFEDASTAAVMNEHFVNVKVDREERPDLDAVYMEAVVALSGHGGWPMTVFLTPAGEPFYGGTYYPPEPRHGMPSFRQLLDSIAEAWRDRRDDVSRAAAQLVEAVRHSAELRPSNDPLTELGARRRRAAIWPRRSSRPTGAGGGRRSSRTRPRSSSCSAETGEAARAMVVKTLDEMAAGGMYDLLGGGFHRYSVDDRWLVPHFEKMLYDNALLAAAYLHGWLVTGTDRYREIASETVEYMLRELLLPEGGFASAQDADTDGVEGLTFTWTEEEGVAGRAARAVRARPLDHPRRARRGDARAAARDPGAAAEAAPRRQGDRVLERARARGARGGRAAARAGRTGSRRRGGSATSSSARSRARTGGCGGASATGAPAATATSTTTRTSRTGCSSCTSRRASCAGCGEAHRLARLAVELFADEERGGFFLSPADGEQLVARTKELDDHPLPSGNSMLAHVLLRLARIYGDDELERRGVSVLRLLRPALERVPSAFGWGLVALDLHLSPPHELAIVGPVDSDVARAALEPWQPTDGRGGRPGRGRAAARGQGAGRRAACRLRLRAICVPRAGHRSGPHLTRMCQVA